MNTQRHLVYTPVGSLLAELEGDCLHKLAFADETIGREQGVSAATPALMARVAEQLAQWFAGSREDFDLPLAPVGTAFQRAVWAAASQVPAGTFVSYATLAERLGRPGAARAVGTALARNPFLLIVPCHRVLASDGSLGGYAGGLERKRRLLELERERQNRRAVAA